MDNPAFQKRMSIVMFGSTSSATRCWSSGECCRALEQGL